VPATALPQQHERRPGGEHADESDERRKSTERDIGRRLVVALDAGEQQPAAGADELVIVDPAAARTRRHLATYLRTRCSLAVARGEEVAARTCSAECEGINPESADRATGREVIEVLAAAKSISATR